MRTVPTHRSPKSAPCARIAGDTAQGLQQAATTSASHAAVNIGIELKGHAPFTILGAISGVAIMIGLAVAAVPRSVAVGLFWSLHPMHVFLSALVTTAMYTLHSRRDPWAAILVGYVGAVGIATLSDCVIPYVGESLLGLPNRGIHLGFVEKWWLVNPLAAIGILAGYRWPSTKFPHAGHMLLSTWASLFHTMMAMGPQRSISTYVAVGVFLFFSVWIPCCTSDIVFPLLFAKRQARANDVADSTAATCKPQNHG